MIKDVFNTFKQNTHHEAVVYVHGVYLYMVYVDSVAMLQIYL